MTSPFDYNQHLLAYLQAWRQLLEASAAMTSGLPFPPGPSGMPPTPPMPPMPFVPPMAPPGTSPLGASPPTDYTQQLFGYLQAWRQYLEQAIAAAPAQGASTITQPTAGQPTGSQPTGSQSSGSQPTGSQSSGSQSTGSQSSGSQSSFGSTTPPIVVPPRDDYGIIGDHDFGSGFQELLSRPEFKGFASTDPRSGSAFAAKAASVASGPSIQPATQSLFSRRAADTPSVTGMQTGRDPRRAAPPATSRWWEAGQGLRPGFKDKPDPKNLLNIRPLDLGGEQ
jgi:hypothetical protein